MVSWWGVSHFFIVPMITVIDFDFQACLGRFPTWRSLARDRLCIPASSVSSERAFSAGGITISKRRNRLKGDIVEALQVLKSLIRGEDMFRAPAVSTVEEDEDEREEGSVPDNEGGAGKSTVELSLRGDLLWRLYPRGGTATMTRGCLRKQHVPDTMQLSSRLHRSATEVQQ